MRMYVKKIRKNFPYPLHTPLAEVRRSPAVALCCISATETLRVWQQRATLTAQRALCAYANRLGAGEPSAALDSPQRGSPRTALLWYNTVASLHPDTLN